MQQSARCRSAVLYSEDQFPVCQERNHLFWKLWFSDAQVWKRNQIHVYDRYAEDD